MLLFDLLHINDLNAVGASVKENNLTDEATLSQALFFRSRINAWLAETEQTHQDCELHVMIPADAATMTILADGQGWEDRWSSAYEHRTPGPDSHSYKSTVWAYELSNGKAEMYSSARPIVLVVPCADQAIMAEVVRLILTFDNIKLALVQPKETGPGTQPSAGDIIDAAQVMLSQNSIHVTPEVCNNAGLLLVRREFEPVSVTCQGDVTAPQVIAANAGGEASVGT